MAKIPLELLANLEELFAESLRPVAKRLKVVRDPTDDMLVECAIEYHADYIVSLDKDLLVLKNYGAVMMLSPSEFLKRLRKKD